MNSPRFTFSLAQLLLLVMLTGMLCAWLPEAVRWNQLSVSLGSERQSCTLSQDGAVLFCRCGERGFAAFDTASGRTLLSQEEPWKTDASFDPAAKKVYFVTYTEGGTRYSIRTLDLSTGKVETGESPVVPRGLQIDASISASAGRAPPLIHAGKVFDFLGPDGSQPWRFDEHLRCWNLASGSEEFCVPIGDLDYYKPEIARGKIVYIATEQFRDVARTALFVRDAEAGGVNRSKDFMERSLFLDDFVLCHRSDDAAVLRTNMLGYDSNRMRNQSGVFLIGPQTPSQSILELIGMQISRIAFDEADESIWHLGIREDGRQMLTRRDLKQGKDLLSVQVGEQYGTIVTDFRLASGQIALASDDGTFRLLDAKSGGEIRRLTGLRYAPSQLLLRILAGAAVAWAISWWRAMRTKQPGQPDLARLIGPLFLLGSLFQGLLLMSLRDQEHQLNGETASLAIVFPSLGAATGMAFLLDRNCNRLTVVYGVLAFAAMALYAAWAAFIPQ
jgi:hypothetical protein